jgi:hypothetical protein
MFLIIIMLNQLPSFSTKYLDWIFIFVQKPVSGASLPTEFKLNGADGLVTLTTSGSALSATMKLTSGAIPAGSFLLKVHELPVQLDVKDPCDPANLGTL